ncbi:hypothetical protein CP03DC29_0358B, partial [Chlamydia psittaci 03DC29]
HASLNGMSSECF